MLVSGSTAAPDQLAPPALPGTGIVPRSDGGVNSAAAIVGLGDLDRLLVNLRREIDQVVVGRALDVERRGL